MAALQERLGATISAYSIGFLPLPGAVTVFLMLKASSTVDQGSASIFWVLVAALPAALVLGPYYVFVTLRSVGDPQAARTGKLCSAFGALGLVLMIVPFGFLLYLGWIGLVADLALVGATVPALARQRVMTVLRTERIAARVTRS